MIFRFAFCVLDYALENFKYNEGSKFQAGLFLNFSSNGGFEFFAGFDNAAG